MSTLRLQLAQTFRRCAAHVLVQLLRDCAAQRTDLQRRLADAEQRAQEFSDWKERRYIVDTPKYGAGVDEAMQYRAEAVTSKWARGSKPTQRYQRAVFMAMCFGMLEIVYDFKLQTFKLLSAEEVSAQQPDPSTCLSSVLADVISSLLLLYRLRCLFPVDRYKSVWLAGRRGAQDQRPVSFVQGAQRSRLGASVRKRFQPGGCGGIELINLLCDPRCPHTYDGTVAGTMAWPGHGLASRRRPAAGGQAQCTGCNRKPQKPGWEQLFGVQSVCYTPCCQRAWHTHVLQLATRCGPTQLVAFVAGCCK